VTAKLGDTQNNHVEVAATVDGAARSEKDVSRSFSHEAGHTAGLEHPWSATNNVSDIQQGDKNVSNSTVQNNLMNSAANPVLSNQSTSGTSLTTGQLKSVDATVQTQQPKANGN